MPKPRLARRLFTAYSVALVTVMGGCYWLSTVYMASITEEAEFERMTTTAIRLADALKQVVDVSDQEQVTRTANKLLSSNDQKFELFDFQGNRLATIIHGKLAKENEAKDDQGDALPNLKQLLDETKGGRIAKTSRYNVSKNSRLLVVAVPFSLTSTPLGALCLSVDTQQTDHILADAFKKLLIGFIVVGLFALFIGWLIAPELVIWVGMLPAGCPIKFIE